MKEQIGGSSVNYWWKNVCGGKGKSSLNVNLKWALSKMMMIIFVLYLSRTNLYGNKMERTEFTSAEDKNIRFRKFTLYILILKA